MKLYNSLSRKIEEFAPINPPNVGMYACGPTVYDNAHIGHMRKYVGDDTLRRALRYFGLSPKLVMNLTDVGHLVSDGDTGEDKMEKGARKHGLDVWEVAKKFTDQFFASTDRLGVDRPDVVCRATDHIDEQIALISRLEDKGFIYEISDGVYFDTDKLTDYGKLSGVKLDELVAGARVEVNNEKKNPLDFALWKFSYEGGRPFDPKQDQESSRRQMEWDSPWGLGFPGWHIECSAMSMKYLGEQFDIHTGGIDHVPIHHTNEIAQSEAATGKKPFVRYWVHYNFLTINNEKMSKSLGNLYTVDDIETKGYTPLALRYLFLTAHYRRPLNFTWESLTAAQTGLERLYSAAQRFKLEHERTILSPEKLTKVDGFRSQFQAALSDDLNMPEAMAVVWELVKSNIPGRDKYDLLLDFDQVLGLGLEQAADGGQQPAVPQEIAVLVSKRESLRKHGKFAEADAVRGKIEALGYVLEDTLGGVMTKKKQ